MAISDTMTVIAMINGMIGGIILVLPILALQSGYLLIGPITVITGFISFFSCLLCLRHLRNYKDLDEAVLKHFNNDRRYQIAYDLIVAISMIVLLILYFNLICEQWTGITKPSPLISILNFIGLIPIIFIMKKFDFGASLLAYGILSIIGYVVFIVWMLLTSQQGHEQLQPTGSGFSNLAAGLSQGFAIQTFFIPVLKKNEHRQRYKLFLIVAYLVGTVVYMFIGYGGSYSIVNRVPIVQFPDTIQDYFPDKNWEIVFIEIVYLIHLYSAFPEFLLIAKKRIFNVFKFKNTQVGQAISKKQIACCLLILLLCFVVEISGLRSTLIIELNGAIVSFFFIYIIPIGLHTKCVYFSQGGPIELNQQKNIEMNEVDLQHKGTGTSLIVNKDLCDQKPDMCDQKPNKIEEKESSTSQKPKDQTIEENSTDVARKVLACDVSFLSKGHQNCEVLILILMLAFGIFTMVHTLSQI